MSGNLDTLEMKIGKPGIRRKPLAGESSVPPTASPPPDGGELAKLRAEINELRERLTNLERGLHRKLR